MIMNEALMKSFVPEGPSPTLEDFAARAVLINAMPVPWAQLIDISNAVVWWASGQACYITGIASPVDAGVSIK